LFCYIFAPQLRALLCPKKRKLCKGKCKGERSSKCWPIKGVGRVRIRNRICFRFMRGTWWQGREPNAPVELPVATTPLLSPTDAHVRGSFGCPATSLPPPLCCSLANCYLIMASLPRCWDAVCPGGPVS